MGIVFSKEDDNYDKENGSKTVLLLGNGFDLQLGLKSTEDKTTRLRNHTSFLLIFMIFLIFSPLSMMLRLWMMYHMGCLKMQE